MKACILDNDCELCGERFNYRLALILVEMPEGNMVNTFACELCAEEFDVAEMLDEEIAP